MILSYKPSISLHVLQPINVVNVRYHSLIGNCILVLDSTCSQATCTFQRLSKLMAESQNWQLYGPFDLGMHDFMDKEFEFDFREEFLREFPAVVPLDHTRSTQHGKTYICIVFTGLSVVRNDKIITCTNNTVLQEAQGVQNKGTMTYQCYNLMRQWRHLLTSKRTRTPSEKLSLTSNKVHMVCKAWGDKRTQ